MRAAVGPLSATHTDVGNTISCREHDWCGPRPEREALLSARQLLVRGGLTEFVSSEDEDRFDKLNANGIRKEEESRGLRVAVRTGSRVSPPLHFLLAADRGPQTYRYADNCTARSPSTWSAQSSLLTLFRNPPQIHPARSKLDVLIGWPLFAHVEIVRDDASAGT